MLNKPFFCTNLLTKRIHFVPLSSCIKSININIYLKIHSLVITVRCLKIAKILHTYLFLFGTKRILNPAMFICCDVYYFCVEQLGIKVKELIWMQRVNGK